MENLSNASEIVTPNVTVVNAEKSAKLQAKKDAKKSATNVPKKNIVTKESKQGEKLIAKLNLSAYSKQLQSFVGAEKQKKDTIYIYPETMSELQKSGDEGKRFRNGLRNAIIRFANNVIIYAKHNRTADLQNEIKSFEVFYKKNYRLNDFSLSSVSQSKIDAKTQHIKLFLDICKDVIAQTGKTSKKK